MSSAAIEQLRGRLRGALLLPADNGYDQARNVYNAMIDRRPAMIARCTGAADVAACVVAAREHNLVVSVRGGGHNVAGNAVCDAGLMIDLTPMKGVVVDAAQRTAWVQGGVTLGEFDREAQLFGLATTLGVVSLTGVAGLTLGGGIGWLNGLHGLACDNLVGAQVVTADGRALAASATENEDLFWAIRGGGGNFGVVTGFQFRLHRVDSPLAGLLLYPVATGRDVLRAFRDLTASTPDELTVLFGLLDAPAGGTVAAIAPAYFGPEQKGRELLKPLGSLGAPLADLVSVMPYAQLQSMFDAGYPFGFRHYWKSGLMRELPDVAIDVMLDFYSRRPTADSQVFIEHLHGATQRVGPTATAFPHRGERYNFMVLTKWAEARDDERCIRWTREYWQAMEPFVTGGHYVNYLGHQETPDRVRAAYGVNYDRLAAIKEKYDPANLFRMNQNISPQPPGTGPDATA